MIRTINDIALSAYALWSCVPFIHAKCFRVISKLFAALRKFSCLIFFSSVFKPDKSLNEKNQTLDDIPSSDIPFTVTGTLKLYSSDSSMGNDSIPLFVFSLYGYLDSVFSECCHVDSILDLGIIICKNLRWDKLINLFIAKASKVLKRIVTKGVTFSRHKLLCNSFIFINLALWISDMAPLCSAHKKNLKNSNFVFGNWRNVPERAVKLKVWSG